MSKSLLITNAQVINEGQVQELDLYVENGRIAKIGKDLQSQKADRVIDATGKYLMPGVIDDQVHFREPGFTHKAEIYTEAKAAVAGGTTSFMEMPNTSPQTLTQELLEEKYQRAADVSLANYSFYMGASNDNLEEVLKTPMDTVCGVKVFMGSSTGNMLVDQPETLKRLFDECPLLIATHCEDEPLIRKRSEEFRAKYGEDIPVEMHPEIRNVDACFKSSSLAVELAKKYNTRLHILHLSTAEEMALFRNDIPLKEKRITAEACVHHLWFTADDYAQYGAGIKCNPAIKEPRHREAVWAALLDDRIDVIATDHAPHTSEEKANKYWGSPSGVPLVQHSLLMMLEMHKKGRLSLETLVRKMCHAVADCFRVKERGYIREGYWADLVLFDLNAETAVSKENLLYKCGWSPFEGQSFTSQITHTIVSGHVAYENGKLDESKKGERLLFAHN